MASGRYSKIDICNIAFSMLGADSIRDFSERNARARLAANLYDLDRDYILSQCDWSFARKFVQLNALVDGTLTVPAGLTAYQIPNDCLKPLEVYPRTRFQKYEIVQDKIVTDIDTPYLKYTYRETNEALFPAIFSLALGSLLASHLAPSVTQDLKLAQLLDGKSRAYIMEAIQNDAVTGDDYPTFSQDANNDTFVYPDLAETPSEDVSD